MPNHLWFTDKDVAALRHRLAEGHPHVAGLWRVVRPFADRDVEQLLAEGFDTQINHEPAVIVAQSAAVGCLLTGDAAYAARAHDALLRVTEPWSGKNLTVGHWGLLCAAVHEACYAGWNDEQRHTMTRLVQRCAAEALHYRGNNGDPHAVSNNHWSVNHGGALVAAMAAHAHRTDPGGEPLDMTETIRWARGRVKAFATQVGNAGLYHEGLGYSLYAFDFLLPAVLACRGFDGDDMTAAVPGLREMAASFYLTAADRPAISDAAEKRDASSHGMMLSWNDAGQSWHQGNAPINMIALAHERQRGALRRRWDRLSGHQGPNLYAPQFVGYFFALVSYPYDDEPAEPNEALPRRVTDHRQGLHIARNRYADGDDAILGMYAKTTFAGGHKQDDAGSVRFMALGHDWIMGGGQARGKVDYQSTCFPADGSRDDKALAPILLDEATEHGSVFGMDLRRVSVAYHERYAAVDYSAATGCPAVIALLDQIDDHRDRAWDWTLSFENRLAPQIHDDQHGFTLLAPDAPQAPRLTARFLASLPTAITLEQMPDSQRTFQGGQTVHYPGRRFLRARFEGVKPLGIVVAMAVSRDGSPTIERAGEGVGVRIGAHVWARPFGAAVPPGYRPGVSGSLCKYPDGLLG